MYEYKAEVIRVIDGDTIFLNVNLGFNMSYKTKMRLFDIDCPETRTRDLLEKARGHEAKAFVEDEIKDKKVIIKTQKDKTGKFGRVLGDIYYESDNKTLSLVEQLKKNGHEKEK